MCAILYFYILYFIYHPICAACCMHITVNPVCIVPFIYIFAQIIMYFCALFLHN